MLRSALPVACGGLYCLGFGPVRIPPLKPFTVFPGRSALLRGIALAVVAMGWLAQFGRAEVLFPDHPGLVPPGSAAPSQPPSPKVDYNLQPPVETQKGDPLPPSEDIADAWKTNPATNGWFGPVENFAPLPLTEGEKGSGNATRPSAPQPTTIRLGNVTFNQVAASVNAWKVDGSNPNDLSRQFQGGVAAANQASAISISGWAVVGLAGFAIILGLVLGQYENDHEDRKRRKNRRHHRRGHRHAD